jgi:hypothetical protein
MSSDETDIQNSIIKGYIVNVWEVGIFILLLIEQSIYSSKGFWIITKTK